MLMFVKKLIKVYLYPRRESKRGNKPSHNLHPSLLTIIKPNHLIMKKSSIQLIGTTCVLFLLMFFSPKVQAQTYCTSTSTNSSFESIQFVSFSGIENASGASGYTDYTAQTAQVLAGISYPMNVQMMNSGGSYTEYITVFIDWNQDGEFNADDGEYYVLGNCLAECETDGVSGSISVPHTALEGTTRMRIIGADGLRSTACGSFTFGEVEDYSVNVSVGECAPDFDYVITNDCQNETYSVSAVLNDFGNNAFISVAMTRSDGVSVFPVTMTSDLPQGYVFVLIEDVPTGVTVTASVQTVDTQCTQSEEFLSLGCYCIPEYTGSGCNFNYTITNVSLSGENIDLDNASTCSGISAYAYYSDLEQPDLAPGEQYTLSVTTGYTSPTFVQAIAWIDFNKDSELDADEIIGNTNGSGFAGGIANFNFVVPDDVEPGENYRLRVRLVYGSGVPTWDACSSQFDGETEDYKVTILQLPDCDGIPLAGYPEEETIEVCANTDFTLNILEASDAANGLTRIWQSSPAGEDTWTDIAGSFTSYVVSGGIDVPMDFRFRTTCDNSGETSYSTVLVVTIKPAVECYCTPTYTYGCGSGDVISNVSLSGESISFDNTTTCSPGAYGDYTTSQPSPDLAPGETYSLSVSTSYGSPASEDVYAWIDYNQNGIFDPSELIATTGTDGLPTGGTEEFDFTLPDDLAPNSYRLRVRLIYNSASGDPCINYSYGETEDYTVTIIDLNACDGTPSAGTPDDPAFEVCAFDPFNVVVSDAADAAGGLTRIWQSSPAGQNDWTDIEGATSVSFQIADGISEPTDFRYTVSCEFSGESDISDIIEVTLKPGTECYCTPTYTYGCGSGDLISNVSLSGESISIDNTTTCSPGAYGDYTTSQPNPDLAPGETYSISVSTTYGSPSFEDVYAWIDYNQNGVFEPGELIATTGTDGLPPSGTQAFDFTVPGDLAPNSYRL